MTVKSRVSMFGVLVAAALISIPAYAVDWTGPSPAPKAAPATASAPTAPNAPQYSKAELDQMLAPVALYPDDVLSSILTAATYPLQVVEADRWVQMGDNAKLKGDQLNAALDGKPWDPTVKSLVAFPPVLKMMDENLEWTQSLGEAFIADQAGVMDSVQRLRRSAKAAGRLPSNNEQTVSTQNKIIIIQPKRPDVVYLPCYDPFGVYGPWPWPEYPPVYFPGYYCTGTWITFGVGFTIGPYWGWGYWDWPRHRLYVHHRYVHAVGAPYAAHGRRLAAYDQSSPV